MPPVIKVQNLSKVYQLGEIGTGTISNDLARFWAKMRGKEDPFLKIGEVNDRATKGQSDVVWSLKDINFEIEQGDAVGIIGRNGAGKSTLLKILSRVTAPTTGSVKLKGRIASLLEVGTGFHPDLSGRENIYLNGAILGMRRAEIKRKFDEIVDFSGVERYIDTPVKRYSSGMYVRLAFAVAAHLESEILIVDEVLSVGDAEFQKKCLGKMGDVSKGEGRTVLFVSHNLTAVANLCNSGVLMIDGHLKAFGEIKSIIKTYEENIFQKRATDNQNTANILKHAVISQTSEIDNGDTIGTILDIELEFEQYVYKEVGIDILIKYEGQNICFGSSAYYSDLKCGEGRHRINCRIGPINFAVGSYSMDINICLPMQKWIEENISVIQFDISRQLSSKYNFELRTNRLLGYIIPDQKWSKKA